MLASLVGLSMSIIPCLVFGVIMMVSFLLCNCEYIGERVAQKFCQWKNRRKARWQPPFDSSSYKKSMEGQSRDGGVQNRSTVSEERVRLQMSVSHEEVCLSGRSSRSSPVESAPSLSNITTPNSANLNSGSGCGRQSNESDPPPPYDECFKQL